MTPALKPLGPDDERDCDCCHRVYVFHEETPEGPWTCADCLDGMALAKLENER